jgi:hypothetical protein
MVELLVVTERAEGRSAVAIDRERESVAPAEV